MKKDKQPKSQLRKLQDQLKKECIPYDYDTKQWPIETLVEKYKKEKIFIPVYQRQFVWDKNRRSKFIESMFLGVPMMPLFFAVDEDKEANLEIVDGSQRIRTLEEYIDGDLTIINLKKLTELNNKTFNDLPEIVKNRFLLKDFRCHVVDKSTPEIRADIFQRINTGSLNLNSSEVRTGAYQGKFYLLISEISKLEKLHKLCPISKNKKNRGEYEELILRFFAYSEKYLDFKHNVSPFLDDFLKDKNDLPDSKLDVNEYKNRIIGVLDFVEKYFSPPYFAKKDNKNSTPRVRFEAIAVGVYLALQEKSDIVPNDMRWLDCDMFKDHTTSDASNNKNKLRGRLEFVRDCLLGKLIFENKYERSK